MVGLRQIVIGVMIVLLFSFSMINFMSGYLTANNPNSLALTNSTLGNYSSRLNDTMSNFIETTNSTIQRLSGDDSAPSAIYLFLIIPAALKIPLDFLGLTISGIKTMGDLFFVQLAGVSSNYTVLFALIVSILVFSFIIFLIKYIRTGESER